MIEPENLTRQRQKTLQKSNEFFRVFSLSSEKNHTKKKKKEENQNHFVLLAHCILVECTNSLLFSYSIQTF